MKTIKKETRFLPIIGMEVHVELKTDSKMFCACSASHFRVKANTHTCPVCLGLPGALPVPNKKAIEWTLLLGLALNCKINNFSKFDRKNYFYPDLAKGYQISQFDLPFCQKGFLTTKTKKISINRVHLEEDTGKLIHIKNATLIDFNRSGVPLVEIVSEPEMNSSEEAVLYLKKIQQTIRYLEISDADMEKGSMRCEVNISLRQNQKLADYKVEVKNINSFRFVKRAIDYEIERQKKLLRSGETPTQETRGFNEKTNKTYSQRSKEAAHDYRYFPEPDLPPITRQNRKEAVLKKQLPELPETKKARFMKKYQLSEYNAHILTTTQNTADYFEEAIKVAQQHKIPFQKISNLIVNKKVNIKKYLPAQFIKMLLKKQSQVIQDKKLLLEAINKVLKENKKAVADFKKGKKAALGFLLGQVMKETKGRADPVLTERFLLEKLG